MAVARTAKHNGDNASKLGMCALFRAQLITTLHAALTHTVART